MAMISSRVVFILYIPILVINIFLLGAQATPTEPSFPAQNCEYVKGSFNSNSTYQANLNRALSSLVQSTLNVSQNYGFFKSSQGQIPNKVRALGLCRGDSEPNVCRDCLENTRRLLRRECANQREAIGGFEHCVLHYSNRSSNGTMIIESQPRAYSWEKTNVPSEFRDVFSHNLSTLLNVLRSQASGGGRFGKYSTGNISTGVFGHNQTIYALAQCRPDSSPVDCNRCLGEVFVETRGNDHQRVGGRVISPSCNFRYEVYRFYGDSYEFTEPPKSLSPPPRLNDNNTTFKPEMSQRKTYGAGGAVVTVASVSLIISIGVYYRFKKTNLKAEVQDDTFPQATDDIFGCEKFDFGTLKAATNNFSEKNKIGTNIFGAVYMGRLSNGQYIAVKRLNYEHRDLFKNEVRFGARLHHPNLVRLIGFCSKGDKKLLVNEYFPVNLERIMFDPRGYLNWDKRFEIIKGTASALCYLHGESQLTIIHRDIKPGKVFLDENFAPKISCFGSTQYYGANQCDRVTTRVVGTVGYLAPECFMGGVVTAMSDVYSFGMLLLEIVSGQRSSNFWRDHQESFASYAWRNWKEGTITNLIDPKIREGINPEIDEIKRCIQIGLLCVQLRSSTRPTMRSVYSMLHSPPISTPILAQSGNFDHDHNFPDRIMVSEASDDSTEGFDSASEMSLSPISETVSIRHLTAPDHELVRERSGVLARLRCVHYRAVRSLVRTVFAFSGWRQYQLSPVISISHH